MADSSSKFDIKTVATVIGLISSLSGVIATWTLMQYRMDQLEERVQSLETKIEEGDAKLVEQAKELRCTICDVHTIPCPGC